MEQLMSMFNFNGDIIITELHNSQILRFDERVNDMDLWSKLKYTKKVVWCTQTSLIAGTNLLGQ
jgi:hypothetical protein